MPAREDLPGTLRRPSGRRAKAMWTAGGVDANASKKHLLGVARELGISGRSTMTKPQLVDAIRKANERGRRTARRV
jgi:hypothetical protein